MNARDNQQILITDFLINDDIEFESLDDDEQDEIIELCSENIDKFRCLIDRLIHDYHMILLNSPLIENENEIIRLGEKLYADFNTASSQFKSNFDTLNTKTQLSQSLLSAMHNVQKKEKLVLATARDAEEAKSRLHTLYKTLESNDSNIQDVKSSEIALAIGEEATAREAAIKAEIEVMDAKATANSIKKSIIENTDSVIEINKKIENNESIYYSTVFQLQLIKDNIANQFAALSLQYEAMLNLTKNIGVERIQRRIACCMNIFLAISCQNANNKEYHTDYSAIAKSLGEYLYDEGLRLVMGVSIPYNQNFSPSAYNDDILKSQFKKNILALSFFFLTTPNDHASIPRACYTNIYTYLLNTNRPRLMDVMQFTWEKFAKESPVEFMRLYDILFNGDNEFNVCINEQIKLEHIYVEYNYALFNMYAAIASATYAESCATDLNTHYINSAAAHKAKALQLLLSSVAARIDLAEEKLKKYFPGNINVDIELAVIHFINDNERKHGISQYIYHQIHLYGASDINHLTKSIFNLFHYWILDTESVELNTFASQWIKYFAKEMSDDLAFTILEKVVEKDINYANLLVDIAMSLDEPKQMRAYRTIKRHPNQDHGSIQYLRYHMDKALHNSINYELLISAANRKNELAAKEVVLLTNDDNHLLKNEILILMINMLNENTLFSLNHLKNLYFKKALHLSLQAPELDLFIGIFFPYLLKTVESGQIKEVIEPLNEFVLTNHDKSYEVLLHHSKSDLESVIFLIQFCLNNIRKNVKQHDMHNRLMVLSSIIKIHHADNTYAIKDYALYIIGLIYNKQVYPNLLFSACLVPFQPAIHELIKIIDDTGTTLYGIEDNDSLLSKHYRSCFKEVLPDCIQVLEIIASKHPSYLQIIGETLCVYYARHDEWNKTNLYYQICTQFENSPENICERLEKENCLHGFIHHCNQSLSELIPNEYKLPSEERMYNLYVKKRDADKNINLDLLLSCCSYHFLPAIHELDTIINTNRELDVTFNNICYSYDPNDKKSINQHYFPACINKLCELAASKVSSSSNIAAQALCIYYVSKRKYREAGLYFNICSNYDDNSVAELCHRMEAKNYLKNFLINCNHYTVKVPNKYKVFSPEEPVNTSRQPSVRSAIGFFEQISTNQTEEKEKLPNSLKQKNR